MVFKGYLFLPGPQGGEGVCVYEVGSHDRYKYDEYWVGHMRDGMLCASTSNTDWNHDILNTTLQRFHPKQNASVLSSALDIFQPVGTASFRRCNAYRRPKSMSHFDTHGAVPLFSMSGSNFLSSFSCLFLQCDRALSRRAWDTFTQWRHMI